MFIYIVEINFRAMYSIWIIRGFFSQNLNERRDIFYQMSKVQQCTEVCIEDLMGRFNI